MKAYVFPGQGAQFTGMGRDLYDNNPLAKQMFEEANEILGFRITDIMFTGSADELKQTKVTQPAIFIHSVILSKCIEDFKPDMVAGHSLGATTSMVGTPQKGLWQCRRHVRQNHHPWQPFWVSTTKL